MNTRSKSQESGLRFGLLWSGVGSLVAVCALAACAYIIPPDNQAPRNNQLVDGGKRRPAMNNQVGNARPTIQQQLHPQPGNYGAVPPVQHMPAYAPSAQPAPAMTAPVSPSGQQLAPSNFVTQMPHQAAPAPVPFRRRAEPNWMERNFPSTAKWLGLTSNPEPEYDQGAQRQIPQPTQAAIAAPPPPSARVSEAAPFRAGQPETARALAFSEPNPHGTLAPIPENLVREESAYQTATNQAYPLLQDMPAPPAMTDDAAIKLERARRALEADKIEADRARDALNHEVRTGGPTLMEEYERGRIGAPVPPGDESAYQPAIPSFDEAYGFAPPSAKAPAPAELEPIVLRPPKAMLGAYQGAPKVLHVSSNHGGTSPRVVAVASGGYLPKSRYADRQ